MGTMRPSCSPAPAPGPSQGLPLPVAGQGCDAKHSIRAAGRTPPRASSPGRRKAHEAPLVGRYGAAQPLRVKTCLSSPGSCAGWSPDGAGDWFPVLAVALRQPGCSSCWGSVLPSPPAPSCLGALGWSTTRRGGQRAASELRWKGKGRVSSPLPRRRRNRRERDVFCKQQPQEKLRLGSPQRSCSAGSLGRSCSCKHQLGSFDKGGRGSSFLGHRVPGSANAGDTSPWLRANGAVRPPAPRCRPASLLARGGERAGPSPAQKSPQKGTAGPSHGTC